MAGFRLLLVLACIAEVAMASLFDGLPRPPGYPDTPTQSYGPTPPCLLNGAVVNCEWYGFAHIDYDSEATLCLSVTRAVLANTTRVPPGTLRPYLYYYLNTFVFNTTTNDSYCVYGCFDMSGSGMAPPPATVATPPPETVPAPPPVSLTPPPVSLTPPPLSLTLPPAPSVLVPPPATLFAPPPPPDALAPSTTTPPPPPTNTRVVNLNDAGFLQPRGIVSFVISGALLVLHGILGF